jgi:hypothetical protein
MKAHRCRTALMLLGLLSLLLAGCQGATSGSGEGGSPWIQAPLLPPATLMPAGPPTQTPVAVSSPMPKQLVVLHTNDNWGETEPCG